MKRTFVLPTDHELLYQDDELIITISDQYPEDPEDCYGEEYIRGDVYFWDFDQEEDNNRESGPIRWLDGENKTILIQRTEDPSESVACLNVEVDHGDWEEEQLFFVSAKAAQFLAKRFNRILKVAQGYPLEDNQEILHEDDQFVAVLTKQDIGFKPNSSIVQFVQFVPKDGAEALIWLDDEDKNITIKAGSTGELGFITVNSLNTESHKIAIPLMLARILADRFGKQIINGDPIKELKIADTQITSKIEANLTENNQAHHANKVLPLYSVYCKKPKSSTLIALPILSSVLLPFFPVLLFQIILFSAISRNCTKHACINALQKDNQSSIFGLYFGATLLSLLSLSLVVFFSYLISKNADLYSPNVGLAHAFFSIPFALSTSSLIPHKIKREVASGKSFSS